MTRRVPLAASVLLVASALASCAGNPLLSSAKQHLRHLIFIIQENRSFDHYFGTYPGADGIPMSDGRPTVCLPDPKLKHCVRPFHDPSLRNAGQPHAEVDAENDVNGGRMNRFVRSLRLRGNKFCQEFTFDPGCSNRRGTAKTPRVPDVMGWHDAREIPNYWSYAHHFVLQDHMFESAFSWSLPSHLFAVSGWSANCRTHDPLSCRSDIVRPGHERAGSPPTTPFSWTDVTYLLHRYGVSWGYYVARGSNVHCSEDPIGCELDYPSAGTPTIWNPLPNFQDVHQNGQLRNIQPVNRFYEAAASGGLPSVSWVVPTTGSRSIRRDRSPSGRGT